MKQALWVLLIVVVVTAGVLIFWLQRKPSETETSCAFSGWKRTVGVELDAQVKDLDAVKSKIGISDAQVHDYDTLMKDYVVKYDTACQDLRNGSISKPEYACLRRNMTAALDEIRRFNQAVEAAKSLSDPAAQKQVILKAFDDLHALSAVGYRSNCTSAMDVRPQKISFTGPIPERSVQITNIGNNEFRYSVAEIPEWLDSKPISGSVQRGETVSVALERNLIPVSSRAVKLHIHTDLQDVAEVEVTVDADNAAMWKRLGGETRRKAEEHGGGVRIEDALAAVSDSLGSRSDVREPDRYVFAANVLFELDQPDAAQTALDIAGRKDPEILSRPSVLITQGLIASRRKDPAEAVQLFARAKQGLPSNSPTSSVSNLLTGSVLLEQKKPEAAQKYLGDPDVRKIIEENPRLPEFSVGSLSGLKNDHQLSMRSDDLTKTVTSSTAKTEQF